ncbi:hypothetical protein CCACVL1_06858, partial [Corchorus capsularis]
MGYHVKAVISLIFFFDFVSIDGGKRKGTDSHYFSFRFLIATLTPPIGISPTSASLQTPIIHCISWF